MHQSKAWDYWKVLSDAENTKIASVRFELRDLGSLKKPSWILTGYRV